jgi:glycosyltransferase involved in cell wall biosynthesis
MGDKIIIVSVVPLYYMGGKSCIPSLLKFLEALDAKGLETSFFFLESGAPNTAPFGRWRSVSFINFSPDGLIHRCVVSAQSFLERFNLNNIVVRKALTVVRLVQETFNLLRVARNIVDRSSARLVYSVGESALPMAWALSKWLSVPLIVRSYGLGGAVRRLELDGLIDLRLRLYIKYFRATRYIIVQDGDRSDIVYRALGVSSSRIVCIRNGFDPDLVGTSDNRRGLYLKDGIINLGIVCRHDPEKRVDRFIALVDFLKQKGYPVVAHIAGSGSCTSELKMSVAALGLENDVKFYGVVARESVPDFLSSIDIYFQVNQYSNFGNSIIEAIICRCFVVTHPFDIETKYVLAGNKSVFFLSEPDRVEEVESLVNFLLGNQEILSHFTCEGRRHLISNMDSWEERSSKEIGMILSVE